MKENALLSNIINCIEDYEQIFGLKNWEIDQDKTVNRLYNIFSLDCGYESVDKISNWSVN